MKTTLIGLLALFGSGPALAQEMVGDPAAGEKLFFERCVSCHVIENEAGEVLARGGASTLVETEMNLYGIAGRVPGSLPDTFYSQLMRSYGESGAVWEEENFVAFVLDPPGFLQHATGMGGPSAMWSKVVDNEQQAHDLWAYLTSFSPTESNGAEGEAGTTAPADGETASE